ncbi:MAG: hypothetical protein NTV54_08320, partial [Ignavibacteriales bacterium]|nr:hypothetical protein [Ignavibacteriales bacterium]
LATLAYCLMPTHLHFLVRVRASIGIGHLVAEDASLPEAEGVRYLLSGQISKRLGLLFSSYTKAINKRHHRHGSLFQQRAKAKLVNDERYLLTLISYIHQNPVRAGHVRRPEEWPFSSYLDLIEERNGTLPERELLRQYFRTSLEFKEFSKIVVLDVGHFKKSVDI